MSKFNKSKVMPRYLAVAIVLSLIGLAVVGKAAYTMTVKKDYWMAVSMGQKKVSDTISAERGNILSCDGQLLATSIPEYDIFIDFQPGDKKDTAWAKKRDTLWYEKLDSLCTGLNRIFPETSAEEFRSHLSKGHDAGKRYWRIRKHLVDYTTYCEVKQLPFFNMPPNKGGFNGRPRQARRHPFGSLADYTIGSRGDSARYGLELAYDSVLRGTEGVVHKEKTRNKFINITTTPPVAGADIVTTIDVGMQDLAEKALREELICRNAKMGVAILMEVATGDVKAIVNLTKVGEGDYRERYNDALGYRCEPGSVFKTASILVALDDQVVDTSYVIHTGGGAMKMHGATMRDHKRSGFGDINVARSLEVSSNIGVSYVIEQFYGKSKEGKQRYAEGLHRVGIAEDLKLPVRDYRAPRVRYPDDKVSPWSATTPAWMSIGYETQIAPINTVTFYNAIANNGRMMRPRFIKQYVKDGKVVKECPPEVIKEHIARPEAVKTMQTILAHVVSQGLGKNADPHSFTVAGKTGTAQVSGIDRDTGKPVSYRGSNRQHWLSFAGYFPADNPRYSCIVCVKIQGGVASGGLVSGTVFRKIAQGVVAKDLQKGIDVQPDGTQAGTPSVKEGDATAANYVLSRLGLQAQQQTAPASSEGVMPNVVGMGASDAVYALEQRGLTVSLDGKGTVVSQSIAEGTELHDGMACALHLK